MPELGEIRPAREIGKIRTRFCKHCELKKDIKMLLFQNKELLEQVRNLTTTLMGIKSA